jgi:DNA polymerase II small subunit/DNA polymerase delta subunit B
MNLDIEREMWDEIVRNDGHPSRHVGVIGDTIAIFGTVQSVEQTRNTRGRYWIIKLEDNKGNVYVTFSTSNDLVRLCAGDQVGIEGTVRKHDKFNGVKQTILNNVRVV